MYTFTLYFQIIIYLDIPSLRNPLLTTSEHELYVYNIIESERESRLGNNIVVFPQLLLMFFEAVNPNFNFVISKG